MKRPFLPAFRHSFRLDCYILRQFLPALLVSMAFFMTVIQVADLVAHVFRYLQNGAGMLDILRTLWLHSPKAASYALPMAVLFSVAYSLGSMYANNELIVLYASGVSLASFVRPLVLVSILISVLSFFFEDRVVLPATASKNQLSDQLLGYNPRAGAAVDLVLLSDSGRLTWSVEYFDATSNELAGVLLVERDQDGRFLSRLNAQTAVWNGEYWRFRAVRRFSWEADRLTEAVLPVWEDPAINEPPASFLSGNLDYEVMNVSQMRQHLDFLRQAGLPYSAVRAEYLKRYAFSLTPLVVMLLAAVFTGRVKKNILLMSLLFSLLAATLYYVTQMVAMLLAKNDMIPAFWGAFASILIFLILALPALGLRRA